ncbi:MAG: O-antigen ligase family protein, partial [Desulfobacterales bacterium]|nr:O-antigen ligase family protein [Desulfobacterales bacterium]
MEIKTFFKVNYSGENPKDLAESVFFFLICLFTVSNCLHHFTAVRNIALSLSALLLFTLIKKQDIWTKINTPILVPLLLFGMWAIIGMPFSTLDRVDNIHDFFSHYLKYVLFYISLICTCHSYKRLNILLWSIVVFFAAYYLWVMVDYYVVLDQPITRRLGQFIKGITYKEFTENIEGFLTITALFFSFMLFKYYKNVSQKVILICCIVVFIVTSILPQSRGTVLALVISTIIYFARHKIIVISIIFCMVVGLSVGSLPGRLGKIDFFSDNTRKDIFLFSMQVFKDAPVLGHGFNIDVFKDIKVNNPKAFKNYKQQALVKENYHYRFPHSSLLSILVRTGI